MNKSQQQVLEFHQIFGAPVADKPTLIPEADWKLRVGLILEELIELEDAFLAGDLIEVADALGDLRYVVDGGGVQTGIDLDPIVDEIHRSNMTKLGADGKPIISRGEELDGKPLGKVLKGPNYEEPDIASVLAAQQ